MNEEKELDYSLSKELGKSMDIHKCTIIEVALTLFHDSIYDSYLLEGFKEVKGTPKEKATHIVKEVIKDKNKFDKLYDLCWILTCNEFD